MKKKILAMALIIMALSIVAYGTLAYFSYEDTATNVIVAGNIKIALREWSETDGGERVSSKGPMDILPGLHVSRIIEVENTGKNAAWIRVSVSKAIELAAGKEGQVDTDLVGLNLNTEYWTEQEGYYYYKDVLQPGETTQPLFTEVQFSSQMSNLYQQSKAILTIQAHAVQTANNGTTVLEAAGWPGNQQ